MITFDAPYEAPIHKIRLPNPNLGDSENLQVEVAPKRAMDGTLYTYTKNKDSRRKFVLNFVLTRLKALELERFVLLYHSNKIQMIDHLTRTWLGYFISNPIEFTTSKRGSVGNELVEVSLEFEGEIV